ncbi:hypothetical protein QWY82_16250 [Simiduia curdlanivorans]|uniref:DUF3302 domain-containing protein n=1 Tax=Simiduia curdlanivorans TaxID=1492769 RepID=A0ABV8UZZ6_9GAMM|nr:hypothetical protein [Simiduia curdlanivorans]MDN3640347.1 hypothetical protein [Simiduia curdlanivorans]
MTRNIFLTASITLSIWYILLAWDLAAGQAPAWLAPAIKELVAFQNGALLLIAALVPLILFWAWIHKCLDYFALKKLAQEIRAKRKL